jgi:hypothetical protein
MVRSEYKYHTARGSSVRFREAAREREGNGHAYPLSDALRRRSARRPARNRRAAQLAPVVAAR